MTVSEQSATEQAQMENSNNKLDETKSNKRKRDESDDLSLQIDQEKAKLNKRDCCWNRFVGRPLHGEDKQKAFADNRHIRQIRQVRCVSLSFDVHFAFTDSVSFCTCSETKSTATTSKCLLNRSFVVHFNQTILSSHIVAESTTTRQLFTGDSESSSCQRLSS
jgi:hypothetical protein